MRAVVLGGFGLGFSIQDALGGLLNGPLSNLIPGQLGDPNHDSLALAAIFGLSFFVGGLIAGIGLGLALGPTIAEKPTSPQNLSAEST